MPIVTVGRPRPPDRATSRASSRRSRTRSCAARSTSRCTAPRTCPASCRPASRSPRRRRPRTRATRWSAPASLDELRDAAPGSAPSSLRRRSQLLAIRPDLEVSRCAGTSTPACASSPTASYDAIVLALAGLRRLGRDDEAGAVLELDDFVPAPGPGRARARDRARRRAAPRSRRAALDDRALARAPARPSARSCDARRELPHAGRSRRAPSTDGGDSASAATRGCPTAASGSRDRLERSADDPAALGEARRAACWPPGAGELLRRAEAMQAARV